MEREPGVEGGSQGFHFVIDLAQRRGGGHAFEVPHNAQGQIQWFGERVQPREGIGICARAGVAGKNSQTRFGLGQQLSNRRLDVVGPDVVERDQKARIEEWIVGVGMSSHSGWVNFSVRLALSARECKVAVSMAEISMERRPWRSSS